MEGDVKSLMYLLGQGFVVCGGIVLSPLQGKIKHLIRAFVGSFRTPVSREQASDSQPPEGILCNVKSLPAETEDGGNLGHELPVDPMAAQHFVLDLHVIPPIEKLIRSKRCIIHTLGVGMKRALGA
jgi:hypothetical protein